MIKSSLPTTWEFTSLINSLLKPMIQLRNTGWTVFQQVWTQELTKLSLSRVTSTTPTILSTQPIPAMPATNADTFWKSMVTLLGWMLTILGTHLPTVTGVPKVPETAAEVL